MNGKTVPLGGAPEMAVADGHGNLLINIASKNEIAVFDAATQIVTARWPVTTCEKPYGVAMGDCRSAALQTSEIFKEVRSVSRSSFGARVEQLREQNATCGKEG